MEHNLLVSLFPEAVQEEIFGKQPYVIAPACAMPPGSAVPVVGGYRVTGRWRYATGVMHADWAMGMAVDTTNPSDARWFLFPMADATVYDVWHMDGMAGTGSNDVAVEDVFVPADRALSFQQMGAGTTPGALLHDNPMYRVAITPFLAIASAIPIIGAAKGVVERCREDLPSRVSFGIAQMDRPAVLMALGQAATDVELAEVSLRQSVRDLMRLAESDDRGGPRRAGPDPGQRRQRRDPLAGLRPPGRRRPRHERAPQRPSDPARRARHHRGDRPRHPRPHRGDGAARPPDARPAAAADARLTTGRPDRARRRCVGSRRDRRGSSWTICTSSTRSWSTGPVRPAGPADVAVRDGVITEVGDDRPAGLAGSSTPRATSLTPGFVDIHTHFDGQVCWDKQVTPSSWHGVTTVVMGNCGVGFAPVRPGHGGRARRS